MPLTLSCSAQIAPAPMKPIPATMPAAMRAGSMLKLMDTIVNNAAPSDTSMCVRNPAGLCVISRSMPTRAPNATARSRLRKVSRVNAVCITKNYAYPNIKTRLQTHTRSLVSAAGQKTIYLCIPITFRMPHDCQKHLGFNR